MQIVSNLKIGTVQCRASLTKREFFRNDAVAGAATSSVVAGYDGTDEESQSVNENKTPKKT